MRNLFLNLKTQMSLVSCMFLDNKECTIVPAT
jgi:hypothetical protein